MKRFSSFGGEWQVINFLSMAEAGVWAYFLLNLGLVLLNFHEFPRFMNPVNAGEAGSFIFFKYLKRAGLALLVVAVLKLGTALYTGFAMNNMGF